MELLEKARKMLTEGDYTCVICGADQVWVSKARGVRPLVDWLDANANMKGAYAADKVVGRATAFLYVLLGVKAVYAAVMSTPARMALEQCGIQAQCGREVPGIINRRGDGPCPFENAVLGISDPLFALEAIRRQQFRMRQPAAIVSYTAGKDFRLDTTGMSGSSIAIFEDIVVKAEKMNAESENQLAMLRWLDGRVPVPKVLETAEQDGWRWTVMTKLRGDMACSEALRKDPHKLVKLLAESLKRLWSLDVAGCPVDQSPLAKIGRVDLNAVDMELVEPDTFGEKGFPSPAALRDWLAEHRRNFTPVVTHGDFCLPNVFFEDGQLSGFLDLGRSGVGDRWTDIAILWRSLRDNFGGHYGDAVAGFHPDELFEALGIEKDEELLRYYLLMDELF